MSQKYVEFTIIAKKFIFNPQADILNELGSVSILCWKSFNPEEQNCQKKCGQIYYLMRLFLACTSWFSNSSGSQTKNFGNFCMLHL